MSRTSQRNALLFQHCYSPYRTTQFEKTIKKRQKGPVLAIKGPFGDLGGPRRALGGQIQHCYSPYRTTQFEKTIKKRQKGPVLAIKGPLRDLGGPQRAPGDQIWSQLPPIGLPGMDSWSLLTLTWYWVPSGSPRGPKKGPFWPKFPWPHICYGIAWYCIDYTVLCS